MPEPNPTSLIPFTFDGAPVRALLVDGEPHFVGKDVAERLGYADPTTAIKSHCRGVQKLHPIQDALGRTQQARILAEPDVLRLIIGSTLPAAQRFEAWVFEEVLPTIRKTGAYTAPGTTPPLTHADKLAEVREARLTFGRLAAQKVWHDVGLRPLSMVPAEPRQSSMFDPPAQSDLPNLSRPGKRKLTPELLARVEARLANGETRKDAFAAEGATADAFRRARSRARLRAQQQH